MSKYLSAAVASLLVVGSQSALANTETGDCPCFNYNMIIGVCSNSTVGKEVDSGGFVQYLTCRKNTNAPTWYYGASQGDGDFCTTKLVLANGTTAHQETSASSAETAACYNTWQAAEDVVYP